MKLIILAAILLGTGAATGAAAKELPTEFDLARKGANKFFIGKRLDSTVEYQDWLSVSLTKMVCTRRDEPTPRPFVVGDNPEGRGRLRVEVTLRLVGGVDHTGTAEG